MRRTTRTGSQQSYRPLWRGTSGGVGQTSPKSPCSLPGLKAVALTSNADINDHGRQRQPAATRGTCARGMSPSRRGAIELLKRCSSARHGCLRRSLALIAPRCRPAAAGGTRRAAGRKVNWARRNTADSALLACRSLSWSLSSAQTGATVRRRTPVPPDLPPDLPREPLRTPSYGHADSGEAS